MEQTNFVFLLRAFLKGKLIQGYHFPSASPTSLELVLVYFHEMYNINLN